MYSFGDEDRTHEPCLPGKPGNWFTILSKNGYGTDMKPWIYLVSLLAILASLLLGACAGVDASVLDTAECIGKGTWGAGMAYTLGIQVPEWLEIDAENIYDVDSAMPTQYMEIEYGVADDIDAKLRWGLNANASNGKLLLKKQISKSGKNSTAFVFGGGITRANEDHWEPYENYGQDIQYQLLTGEAQMIFTKELPRNSFVSFAIRGNYHSLTEEIDDLDSIQTDFYHAGLRVNFKREHKGFYGIFELGAEAPLSVEGWNQVYPWVGMKFSWDIKKKK
ncbi:MAG: hypothetical protein LHW51_00380 [Candidatus Cloacimonetes bacterium]|nr:hypothetical protein [Candidatus Cloacimonadota bacterium]MCK9242023.1 hypothetical protein [Candidatus Cloacimonadota bacterium]